VNRHEHIAEAERLLEEAAGLQVDYEDATTDPLMFRAMVHGLLAVALSHPDKRSFVPHKQQRRSG
jgi:hypothetical protein